MDAATAGADAASDAPVHGQNPTAAAAAAAAAAAVVLPQGQSTIVATGKKRREWFGSLC